MKQVTTNIISYSILCKLEGEQNIVSVPTKKVTFEFIGRGEVNQIPTTARNEYQLRITDKCAYVDEKINGKWVPQNRVSKAVFSGLYLLALAKERMEWADEIVLDDVEDAEHDKYIASLSAMEACSIDYDPETNRLITAWIAD